MNNEPETDQTPEPEIDPDRRIETGNDWLIKDGVLHSHAYAAEHTNEGELLDHLEIELSMQLRWGHLQRYRQFTQLFGTRQPEIIHALNMGLLNAVVAYVSGQLSDDQKADIDSLLETHWPEGICSIGESLTLMLALQSMFTPDGEDPPNPLDIELELAHRQTDERRTVSGALYLELMLTEMMEARWNDQLDTIGLIEDAQLPLLDAELWECAALDGYVVADDVDTSDVEVLLNAVGMPVADYKGKRAMVITDELQPEGPPESEPEAEPRQYDA